MGDTPPRRNLIIGTAGHIDHGKTVLVRALTGRDTDRLAEEKERGISIDLGFAPFEFGDGSLAGIVDVPGHENFIRNMMAGATGVDLALLVVAADDGVMPQTREHLAILELLGVTRAVVAITKTDLVDEEFTMLVAEEVVELLADTPLAGSPVVPVSAVTGTGIDELRAEMERAAGGVVLKDQELPPRLPIDRVFTLKGIGTVITGTLWSGSMTDGEKMELLPSGREVRVRSLQVHDEARDAVYAGERVAANLAGVPRDSVLRGDVLCVPGYLEPTYMVDARVNVLGTGRRLRRGTRLRFHHGTRELLGRIYPLDGEEIAPGEVRPAQLRLEAVAVCAPGDRFVLRSYSPVTTIGGGTVVDAHPAKHRLTDPAALAEMDELESGDPTRAVAVYLGRNSSPAGAAELVLASGLPPRTVELGLERLAASGSVVTFGEKASARYMSAARYEQLAGQVAAVLEEHHREKPLSEGMARETLRAKLLSAWEQRDADMLIERLASAKVIEADGKVVRPPGKSSSVSADQQELLERIVADIRDGALAPPTVSEMAERFSVGRQLIAGLLGVAERDGEVVRVSPELYFSPQSVAAVEAKLREVLAGSEGITVSDFKNLIGTTRKYALPLLEHFDRTRVTVRVGDLRRLR